MSKFVSKENLEECDKLLKKYIDTVSLGMLNVLTYGVEWTTNQKDPHLTRIGNMSFHRTLPILNGMKGCIAQMKGDAKKIIYYLDEDSWYWRKDPEYLKDQTLMVTDGVYTLTNDVFKDLRFDLLYIKINSVACKVKSIDTTNKVATLEPESEIAAGTYNVELGAVVNGYDGEVMVEVPEFWIKSWDGEEKKQVRISPTYIDDTWEHLPHMLISPYRDCLLRTVPENMGYLSTLPVNSMVSICNTNTYCRGGNNNSTYDLYLDTDKFRTMLGKPTTMVSRADARTYVRNSGKEILSYLQYKRVIYWLYVIEYANFNCLEEFNSNLTTLGFKLGGLGMGVTLILAQSWEIFNSKNPITPNGYSNNIGNKVGNKFMSLEVSLSGTLYTKALKVPRWHGLENIFGDSWSYLDGVITSGGNNIIFYRITDDALLYNDSNYSGYRMLYRGYYTGITTEYYLKDTSELMGISASIQDTYNFTYKCNYSIPYSSVLLSGLVYGLRADASSSVGLFSTYEAPFSNVTSTVGVRTVCVLN